MGPRAAGMRLSWPGLTQTPAAAGGPRGAAMTTQQPEPPMEPPELESEIDESELRRELLNDVSSSVCSMGFDCDGAQSVPQRKQCISITKMSWECCLDNFRIIPRQKYQEHMLCSQRLRMFEIQVMHRKFSLLFTLRPCAMFFMEMYG